MKKYKTIRQIISMSRIIFLFGIITTTSCKKSDSPSIPLPVISTNTVTKILMNTASGGGSVTSDGGSVITARGVCWGTNPEPTILDNITSDGDGAGDFTSTLTNLTLKTKYYLRAYATNKGGTSYGSTVTFTTLGNTVTDVDGNVYQTVQIGYQVWMAENLKTTKYRNNIALINSTNNSAWESNTSGAYCWYNNNEAQFKDDYGALYNWYAINNTGLAPEGWHIPSLDEWQTLINTVGSKTDAGAILKESGTSHWHGPNSESTNEFGFNALPGGFRDPCGMFMCYITSQGAYWWANNSDAYFYSISNNSSSIIYGKYSKNAGHSVRCICD